MTFEEVKNCIRQLNVVSVKITDTNGKKIMEFLDELSPENLISKLENFSPTLQTYGRVTFIAANATQYKQNWKDCYQWPVIFSGIMPHLNTAATNPEQANIGFVSKDHAALMATVATLQLQMEFTKQIAELKAQILNAGGKEEKWERIADKYFPIASAMMGIKMEPDQIDNMMKMYQLQAAMSGKVPMMQQNPQQGMAGIQSTPTLQQTQEEQETEKKIVEQLTMLSQKTTDQKILALIQGLNNNPAWVDMAINFMNQPKK
jgi:hypothetical protein